MSARDPVGAHSADFDDAPTVSINTRRPEPVLNAAKLGGLVSAVITTVAGCASITIAGLTAEEVNPFLTAMGGAATAIIALFTYVAPIITARIARDAVTPSADPRDGEGRPLTP